MSSFQTFVAIISPLQNNRYSVKNSRVFAERIVLREQTLEPDEIFVSFDVVSRIPTHLALRITSERLHQDSTLNCERTNLSSDNVMRLLEFALNNVYFTFQGTHYQQVFGCPMSSPISAILANLVMEHIEERALRALATAPHPPKWWYQ